MDTDIFNIETGMDKDFEQSVIDEQNRKSNTEKWKEQMKDCKKIFFDVAELLKDIYEVVPPSGKKGKNYYLIPKGTADQVSYYGKPVNSLRVACAWNWRASMSKCHVREHIQCVTPDMPFVHSRSKEHPNSATTPIYGNMIALFDTDRKYHCVYGEKYDQQSKTWSWVMNTPERIALMIRKRYVEAQANG